MNENERRLIKQRTKEWNDWIARNPGALEGIATLQRNLAGVSQIIQNAAVHWSKAFEQLTTAMGGLANIQAGALAAGKAMAKFLRALPPNWPEELSITRAIELANEGMPVVWVPPGPVLIEVAAAESREAQMAVLHEHVGEIIADVVRTLDEVKHPSLAGQVFLARRAVQAWSDGHHESAQSLAVAVTETVITRYYAKGRSYSKVSNAAKIDLEGEHAETKVYELRFLVAVAPIAAFYTPWTPESGEPAPDFLARHVSVHQADISQTQRTTRSPRFCYRPQFFERFRRNSRQRMRSPSLRKNPRRRLRPAGSPRRWRSRCIRRSGRAACSTAREPSWSVGSA